MDRVPTQMGKRAKKIPTAHTVRSRRSATKKAANKITTGDIQRVKIAANRMKSKKLSGRSCRLVGISCPECFMGGIPDHSARRSFSDYARNQQTQCVQR